MKIIKTKKNIEIIVDDEDFDELSKYTWFTLKKGGVFYVGRSEYYKPYNGKNFRVYISSSDNESARWYGS